MKYISREAQILDFAQAAANVLALENKKKFVKYEYREAIRNYFLECGESTFNRADVVYSIDKPEFQLATGKLYRELLATKKELKNAKRRLDTRYRSLPVGIKTIRTQEDF